MTFRRTAGLLVLCLALACGSWVGWKIWGTNWVAGRQQASIVQKTEKAWAEGRDVAQVKLSGAHLSGAIVRIPAFGHDYAVPLLELTNEDVLHYGFGHEPASSDVGARGNFVIAAHRVTYAEPLRRMPELRAGDRVVIETRTAVFTYRLLTGGEDLRVPLTAGWVMARLPHNPTAGGVEPPQRPGQRLITLVTCAEIFHTDDRLVAFGVLESKEPK
jgi:sortase A